jgi:hypothetical protein
MIRAAIVAIALFAVTMPITADDGLGGTLPPAPPPPANVKDPISAAIKGLVAQIEDDEGPDDPRLVRAKTKDCQTQLVGKKRSWRIDWRTVTALGAGDTFVYVQAPDLKIAIVGKAWEPKQARKLGQLLSAMQAVQARCL